MSDRTQDLMDAASSHPHNLPLQPTPFIGRRREVELGYALLRDDEVRIVTLTGPGGTGKTRLGLQIAGEMLGDFEDGIFFVALALISDHSLVAPTIAQTLGVQEGSGVPLVEALKGYLHSRHMLLILDNFEQVLDAAPLVSSLLMGAPYVKALITSRAKLHLRGEHELPVPPMSMPDTEHLPPPEVLAQYEAIRLFMDRAVAAQSSFRIDSQNALAVAEICHRLDGLPLAIELAAARIKILPPQAMLSRLQDRLRLLTGGERDLPARQRTLRDTINWSYDLLDGDERAMFRRLSVFTGGSSLHSLEAMCAHIETSGPQTLPTPMIAIYRTRPLSNLSIGPLAPLQGDPLDVTQSLADKSLLWPELGEAQEPGPGAEEPRFTMLETIHEYAWERLLESGEAGALQSWHAEHYLELAERAEPELRGPSQVEWMKRLQAEHDNMRSALRWSLDNTRDDLAMRLGAALLPFWKTRGHLTEGRMWLESALRQSAFTPTPERARALMAAGTLASAQADFIQARVLLEQSVTLFKEMEDRERTVDALRNLGNELRHQGDFEAAREHLSNGLALSRQLGDRWQMANLLGDLGIVMQALGEDKDARRMYEESLSIKRELKDKRGIAMMLVNIGEVARSEGDYNTAQPLYQEALTLAQELGDKWGIGMVMHNLGHVAFHQGDYEYALDLLTQSLRLFHELGYRRDVAYCLAALAGLAGALHQPEHAATLFGVSDKLSGHTTSHLDPADRLEFERNLASAQLQLSPNDWERAWNVGLAMSLDDAVKFALQGKEAMVQTIAQGEASLTQPQKTHPYLLAEPDAEAAPSSNDDLDALTPRERDVLGLVSLGLSDAEVAKKLFISPRTVQRHLSSIYSKLGVNSRTAASRYAIEHRLT